MTSTTMIPVALLMCAVAMGVWPATGVAGARFDALVAAGRLDSAPHRRRSLGLARVSRTVVAVAVVVAGGTATVMSGPVVGVVAVTVVALATSAFSRMQVRRAEGQRARSTLRSLSMLHSELACGTRPQDALLLVAQMRESGTDLRLPLESMEVAHQVRGGAEAFADSPDPVWTRVSVAWRLSDQLGVSLTAVVGAVRRDLAAQLARQRDLHSATAGSRASAAIVSALPALGLMLGSGMGADPLGLLLDTRVGHLLMLVGVAFDAAGVLLTRRILRSDDRSSSSELPLLLELIAAGLNAGQPVENCIEIVVRGNSSAWACYLDRVAGLLQLGAESATAWRQAVSAIQTAQLSAAERESVDMLARVATRSAHSGAAMATNLTELAQELRVEHGAAATDQAERAAALVIVPLGLCFLPAFVCLGIIPTALDVSTFVMGSLAK